MRVLYQMDKFVTFGHIQKPSNIEAPSHSSKRKPSFLQNLGQSTMWDKD